MANLALRLIILGVLILAFGISVSFRKRARGEGGAIKRQEEGWQILVLRISLGLPLLIAILLNIFWPLSLSWAKFGLPDWLRYTGLAMAFLCVPLLWWVFSSIGKNISETVLTKDEHELITHGPYTWVRHPLYSGALLLLLSFSLVFGDWIILGYTLAGILVFRLLVIPAEEKHLLDSFGEKYESYQRRTGAVLPSMKKFLDAVEYDAKFIKGHTLQPHWYKILKSILLTTAIVASMFFLGVQKTIAFIGVFFSLSLIVHLVYRVKTEKFTKSWLDFSVQKIDGQLKYERIGFYYYLLVMVNLLLSFWISRFV